MPHEALIETAGYRARLDAGPDDIARSLALRGRVFRGDPAASDEDGFDARCRHLIVEDIATRAVVASCRLLVIENGAAIGGSYSAQFYSLDGLAGQPGRMLEVGRFCIAPEARGADVLRLTWGALTQVVEAEEVEMLFGCSSFAGTAPEAYLDAFALLRARHLAPPRWLPRIKAPNVFRFGQRPRGKPDLKRALKAMPPLLRTYLLMGGFVSDHAVIDRDLGTLHVFTGLEVGRVPENRRRALGALAGA
ncbi:GNAT family N-acetyltransferase [Maritimibacter sp. HL-12]|uniref:GNAT family N-acetyltransferase n=1 Tax=Maritimibacter sp. HL-12 TaxID=1162418 RepID=UPI000A0F10C7|nr:GNAT family N-acetyltransferase [Maritimibacter sp. HL-12]SMH30108.1 ornithine-acyl[acyl carrier protein] N-acyltransferase [Maritimibacter sp. HL-12]